MTTKITISTSSTNIILRATGAKHHETLPVLSTQSLSLT